MAQELKAYHCNEWHNEYTEFYLKSEADKVIAELKADIAEKNKRLRHYKYRLCLALMNWCGMAVSRYLSEGCLYEIEKNPEQVEDCERLALYYDRWFDYLFNLAEKFKEAK